MAEKKQLKAMISSTSLDLPEHRKQVLDACLRQEVLPIRMEDLPAQNVTADVASLEMVDRADIYIGVFAHRYGYIPNENNPEKISISEMEYNRAGERGIPRFLFLMDEDHPVKVSDVEKGLGGEKLDRLKGRMRNEQIVSFFNSPEDLRANVIEALAAYKQNLVVEGTVEPSENAKVAVAEFHYVSSIPMPPEKYIAHPYTLLQTHDLVGRQNELNLLTDWVTKPESNIYRANILSVVAIGGIGKSALTWRWFNDIAPQEIKPLDGRMWWSFYESDASFENFVIRALAYVSKKPIEKIQQLSPKDREDQLLLILDENPFLFVLDGLERILIAYARMDAAYLADSDYDKKTANYVTNAYGLPETAVQSFTGEHRLRKTADPRAGAFLKRLSGVRASRILISTRLYPFDLQTLDGRPLPGCFAMFLTGLSDDDALNLWRSFRVSGAHYQLIPIFRSFGNHALLLQALASEIANYRPAPRDFEKWHEANPNFDPAKYPHLKDAMSHVLEHALRGLDEKEQEVLQTIAAFKLPADYETLFSMLVGEGKAFFDSRELDKVLSELEDRGLVGWDKRSNRYDLHQVVRGLVWGELSRIVKPEVFENQYRYFLSIPRQNWEKIRNLKELVPYVEIYNSLVALGRKGDAEKLLKEQIERLVKFAPGEENL